jgi:WD40 repeat protein
VRSFLFVVALVAVGDAPRAAAQTARLRELDPAMAVRSLGRSGACDALAFTPAGELLGVGDDKVLHRWAVTNGRLRYLEPYLWNTFRETRGAIYALALSPGGRFAAVAGYGRFTSDVSVLALAGDRTGEIVHGLSSGTHKDYAAGEAVWALAFDTSGNRLAVGHDDGSVWVWTLTTNAMQQVARPKADKAKEGTRVLWVGFAGDRVRFVRADGGVFDVAADATADPQPTWAFENGPLYQVRAAAAAGTFVASPLRQAGEFSALEVRDDRGRLRGHLKYNREKVVNRVAIDADGQRVAVGLKDAAQEGRTFFQWADGSVEVFDISGSRPRKIATSDKPLGFAPEALAFDGTGTRLAVAAGPDHETSLWAIEGTSLKQTGIQSGVGSSLWELRVAPDGFAVGFRDRPALDPKHPNARGDGPWRVFDLKARQWKRDEPPAGAALNTVNGWKIEFDAKDESKWTLVSADGTFRYPIVLDPLRDERPICYTFLPARPDTDRVRLAVGHYWGFSVFEAGPGEKPRRVRCASGHAGYVTSIVPAADGKLLFTASRDHTLAVWSTDDWKHHGELGAAFGVEENKLVVKEIDPGGPAWEAGLLPRDRIDRLIVDGAEVVKSTEWLERLGSPVPGHELAFVGKRPGATEPVRAKTLLFQRPQWRFFPTRDDEWVLYRYQDFYYDCSTNGDAYVGWLVGGKTAADSPRFFPAEQYRKLFHQPDRVRQLLERFARTPGEPFSPDVLPPTIAAKLSAPAADGSVAVDFTVTPRRKYAAPDQSIPLERVELWLGDTDNLDHLFWEEVPTRPEEVFEQKKLTIPATLLRNGTNRLVVVAYAQGVRTERALDFETKIVVKRARNLRGLVVGIDAYPGGKWKKLEASVADATAVHAAFKSLADARFFDKVTFEEPLLNEKATPEAIFAAIDKLTAEAGSEDWTMIFLAGHGHGKVRNGVVEPGTWYFVGYNPEKNATAEVSGKAIFDKLKAAKGRKLIFLDACHSGAADESRLGDGARDLRPDGKGPVVLTAAAPDQFAWEAPVEVGGKLTTRGFFSTGLGESLNFRRADADTDGDGILTVGEVFLFTRGRVRELVRQYEKPPQTVQMSPNPLWGLPVTRVK